MVEKITLVYSVNLVSLIIYGSEIYTQVYLITFIVCLDNVILNFCTKFIIQSPI